MLAYSSDGLLLFACNELGFSKANVSAICDMNQSTKTLLKEGKKSCIGEKGVGFKSVFKTAREVWIKSNNYSFKFDANKPLGMVDPVWTEFPSFPEDLRMNTMICLKIVKQEDRDVVRDQLTKVLEPASFMFLRRLSKIRIVRLDDAGNVFDLITLAHEQRPFNKELRQIVTSRMRGSKVQNSTFLVSDYTARELPAMELRPGVTESCIKLAFPVDGNQQPITSKQDVYAFLPVCSSGLPFLIQADFLLVASRQGIDESQPWNRRLQDQIVRAVIVAFQRLNDTPLRYLWPIYLSEEQVALKFFDKLKDRVVDRVRDDKILEARSGELAKPKVMMLVPDQYKDQDGEPLLTPANDRYLSTKYNSKHVSALVTQALDGKKFFDLLKSYVTKQTGSFHDKPGSWHARVCTVLLAERKQFNLDEILTLPVVPLDGGSWVHARTRSKQFYAKAALRPRFQAVFYLPRSDANITIPKGVSMPIIEHEASRNEERRAFFRAIGAQDLDYEDVLRGILKQHKDFIKDADVDLLTSHAQYVFSLPSFRLAQNLSTSLWLADTHEEAFRGIELHMDAPDKIPVSQYFRNPAVARFIHPAYLEIYKEDPEQRLRWLNWLRECLGVHDVPRLANKTNKGLSSEFEWLIGNTPSHQWLMCLKTNWEAYLLGKPPKQNDAKIPSQDVRDKIGNLLVDCTNGRDAKFRDTVLPHLRSVVTNIPHMGFHFLDIKYENDPDWSKFSIFGVITHRNLDFCLRVLMKFADSGASTDRMTVTNLYREIYAFCEASTTAREQTRSAFRDRPLIFLPDGSRWVHLRSCVWEAPQCLQTVRSVAHIYAPVQNFFKNILNLQDAGVPDFVNELVAHDDSLSSTRHIKMLLLELSARINPRLSYNLKALETCRVFPVKDIHGQTALMRVHDTWFIPDGRNLRASFENILHLLDFGVGEQKRLEPLFDKLGVWGRHLSEKVIKHEVVEGIAQALKNKMHTARFQTKAHYLLWCVDIQHTLLRLLLTFCSLADPAERYKTRPLLENIEIWGVRSIDVHRSVRLDNQEIRGKPLPANIMMGKDQRIFVPTKDLEENTLNYYEFSEKLITLCRLEKVPEKLVIGVLSMPSIPQIEDMLEENGIIFDKLELRKLAKPVGDVAGSMLSSSRKVLQPPMEEEASEDDSSSSGTSSLEALKDMGVRVNVVRRPNSVVHVKAQPSRYNKSTANQASQHHSEQCVSEEDDSEQEAMRSLTTSVGSRSKSANGTGNFTRSSFKHGNRVALPDEDINDIPTEQGGSSLNSSQNGHTISSIRRSQCNMPEINMIQDTQAIRIGEQGEMKVGTSPVVHFKKAHLLTM